MTWLKAQAVRLWAWMCADWKRWLILPAVVAGLAVVCRSARGLWDPSPPGPAPAGTLTPDEGENAIDAIDTREAADLAVIDTDLEDEHKKIDEAFK